jgi:hypothetical protein
MPVLTIPGLIRNIRRFNERNAVVEHVRRTIDEPFAAARAAMRARMLAVLPHRGGLGAWAAASHIHPSVRATGNRVSAELQVSRRSLRGPADLRALDRGRVRHPSWGRRAPGEWHTQLVAPKTITGPLTEVEQWRDAVARGVDEAVDTLG